MIISEEFEKYKFECDILDGNQGYFFCAYVHTDMKAKTQNFIKICKDEFSQSAVYEILFINNRWSLMEITLVDKLDIAKFLLMTPVIYVS